MTQVTMTFTVVVTSLEQAEREVERLAAEFFGETEFYIAAFVVEACAVTGSGQILTWEVEAEVRKAYRPPGPTGTIADLTFFGGND